MGNKTQKIAENLHKLLKMQALKDNKTLQELTEELLSDGLENRSQKNDKRTEKNENE